MTLLIILLHFSLNAVHSYSTNGLRHNGIQVQSVVAKSERNKKGYNLLSFILSNGKGQLSKGKKTLFLTRSERGLDAVHELGFR